MFFFYVSYQDYVLCCWFWFKCVPVVSDEPFWSSVLLPNRSMEFTLYQETQDPQMPEVTPKEPGADPGTLVWSSRQHPHKHKYTASHSISKISVASCRLASWHKYWSWYDITSAENKNIATSAYGHWSQKQTKSIEGVPCVIADFMNFTSSVLIWICTVSDVMEQLILLWSCCTSYMNIHGQHEQ